ncbi:extracellular solute-binding protein [Taklimakanibacter deserti]|uniref:extracellular solute-binding protein n=1 Tax=Taklimakanibacter deserti TaxID=2267839 RepID=UPI000E6545F4
MILTRRSLIKTVSLLGLGSLSCIKVLSVERAKADDRVFSHGNNIYGELKYPPDFKHFDYVNPNAPKGGRLRLGTVGSFDTFNPFIIKGDPAAYAGTVFETLTAQSFDEVASAYGLIAESTYHPEDDSYVAFRLRPEARWQDGKPITVEDVIYGFTFLKENNPQYQFYYRNVIKVEKTGDNEVTFAFDSKGNRELPGIMGQAMVIPKHYWEGTNASGKKRNIAETTLEPPLGSGPYRIKSFKAGQSIIFERVKDYWGEKLPVNVGQDNFDEIELIYFRDRNIIFQAFKGDQLDVRLGTGTKEWETQYDFPAVKKGNVIKKIFTTKDAEQMQGFVFNTRRAKFADPRVRHAFNLAYDFEGRMRVLSFGDYNKRTQSYFQNSELAATGLPQGRELEILSLFKDQLPGEVFTTEYVNPVNGTPQNIRANLRKAVELLKEAGWSIKNGALTNDATGERMTMEFLLDDPAFEDMNLAYKPSLERLGIAVTIRTVDSAQYQNRIRDFDFDVITSVFAQSLSPGNEQREYWGTLAADQKGSRNVIGIKNPVVDKIIDLIIFATNRDELIAATKALDRVLLWNYYMVPDFYRAEQFLPYWNRFGYPEPNPPYALGFPMLWWWDEEKAKKTAANK